MYNILILGANAESVPLILVAKNYGRVFVADGDPYSIGKYHADVAVNIDCTNVDAISEYSVNNAIDAVLVGVADRLLQAYFDICTKLNIPCYINHKKQLEILNNKKNFNEQVSKFDLLTIPHFYVNRNSENNHNLETLGTGPYVIKPIDSNSGKGLSIIDSNTSLSEAINYSMNFSPSGTCLVEEFMDCVDIFINLVVFDGLPIIVAIGERHTTDRKSNLNRVCVGANYNNHYADDYLFKEGDKLRRFVMSLGIKYGTIMISAFYKKGNYYHYDPGYRLQGEGVDLHLKWASQFDVKDMLLSHSLEMKYEGDVRNLDVLLKHKIKCYTHWVLVNSGIVKRIEGVCDLINENWIHYVVERCRVGSVFSDLQRGTEGQVAFRIYFSYDNIDDLNGKLSFLKNKIVILDENQKNMILNNK